ncbi:hypothetical protein niasHS_004114 [Heterodera schachtii]|uniref:Integrase catalytic domain-containing protein n=1 Tax=Heterodera schachtii TaxID=97005 RepID=A0ABD2JTX9_HETSC
MKHTKKMVLVPESEYLALMSLLKGGATGANPVKNEKAELDARIQKNLNDTKMDAGVKMKRHSWLYKQRHQLKDMIENKPQKVIVENATVNAPANIAPYMGIQKPAVNRLDEVEDVKKIGYSNKLRRRGLKTYNRGAANASFRTAASYGEETDYSSAPETNLQFSKKRQKFLELKTSSEHYGKMQSIIEQSPVKSPASYAGIQKVLAEAQRRNPNITLRDVHQFLHEQRTYTLFKPRKNRFRRLKTVPSGLHTDWQCDLCIMDALKEHNDGFRYILVCIDVLSRQIFTAEVESKKSEHMIEAFEKIFKKAGVLPNKLYSDAGLEFQAKKMLDYWKLKQVIKHVMYSPHLHAGVVERANRTIKERLYKYFSEKNTKRWVNILDSIVRNLNNSANRTTGLRPVELRMKRKKEELEELERAAEARDQESPENEQRKISEFFQYHPEDYNKKLNESRLIFTQHLSGLQEVMSKYIGEKDINKIRQLNTEVGKTRTKIKYMLRNLTIFENAALQRDHQKSLSEYEQLSHQQNSAFVEEFFQKHPSNYWQIIHNNYRGLTEHFHKIEELQKKAVGLTDDTSFQKQIERAKQLIEYRRKRFAALEFEAKKRDEQQQKQQHTAAANTIIAPTASALIGREDLKKRTGFSDNTDGEEDDSAGDGLQTTTHGEALREKIFEQKKRTDEDKTVVGLQTTTTTPMHGEVLREKIFEQQKHADEDKSGVGPQTTTHAEALKEKILEQQRHADEDKTNVGQKMSTKTHGEALREKILQQQTDDAKPKEHDPRHDSNGSGDKTTRGQTLIAGLKQSDDQKKEWVPPQDLDDDGPALKHGDMLWKLLRSTAPPNQQQQTGDFINRQFVDAEHTRGQVLMGLLKLILEEKTDSAEQQQQHHHKKHKFAQFFSKIKRGEALKELIKKTQNEQLHKSSAKTRGEILKLMLEHMKFSREEEVNFEKLVAGQQKEPTAAEFVFNHLSQRFVLSTGAGVLHVDITKHLAYVLGFDNIRIFHGEHARYMPDLSGGVKQLYVYSPKLIEECIIGDRMAPLLRVVNVSAAPTSGGGTDVPEEGRGEMQYFVGTRYQRGAGLLKNVARFLMPVASNVLKAVSREGVTAGSRIMEDLSQGKAFKESIQAHAKQGIDNLAEKLKQCGKGAPTKKRHMKKIKVPKNVLIPSLRGKNQAIDQLTFAP